MTYLERQQLHRKNLASSYGQIKQKWPDDEIRKQMLELIQLSIELVEMRIASLRKELH